MSLQSKKVTKVSFGLRSPTASPNHCAGINAIAFDEKRNLLFTASRDATVRQWLLPPGENPESTRCHQVHADWVNDIALIPDESKFLTAGSDCGICLVSYNSENTYACLERMLGHKDYVKRILYRSGNIISAGLDGQILVQNFEAAKGWIINWSVQKKHSIYALEANASGMLIASAGADPIIRVYDARQSPRDGKRKAALKLDEHEDTVKSLCMLDDQTLLSGGADNKILHWDLRSAVTPVRTFNLHEDSIWNITAASESSVYSGSRDGDVYHLDCRTGQAQLLIHDSDPISSIVKLPSEDGRLVTASAMGTVKIWNLNLEADASAFVRWKSGPRGQNGSYSYQASKNPIPKELVELTHDEENRAAAVSPSPSFALPKVPSIVKTQILPNRLQILTLDSNGIVELWDIFKGIVSKSFGSVDFEKTLQEISEQVYVPNWCLAVCKLGSMTVSLDGPSCLEAYVLPEDVGLAPTEKAVCLGSEIVNFLFDEYLAVCQGTNRKDDQQSAKILVDLPPDVWVAAITDGICSFVTKIDEWTGREGVPTWVKDVLGGVLPPAKKAALRIKPSPKLRASSTNSELKEFNTLTSPAHLRLTKYISFYAQRVLRLKWPLPVADEDDEEAKLRVEQEITNMFHLRCKGKDISSQITLATLKNCFWKSSGDPLIDLDLKPEFSDASK
eukprot:TRINITY_DN13586_c0_g1_i1.p1 TRINITY_DN13586_c0_g1~~TRINITY_DN13586_c0_g1_i1.p1  ORF type:complete len:676 (-),score=106.55 TRINITY_DN13586_c0_g1_i1:55-2082(-)